MPGKVFDASAVGAWCFREPRRDEAWDLMSGSELYAPLLLAYELANAARKKCIERPEDTIVTRAALRTALNLMWHWTDVDQLEVLRLALETGLTTYDAAYLYLARWLGIPLRTFDERLARAAKTG